MVEQWLCSCLTQQGHQFDPCSNCWFCCVKFAFDFYVDFLWFFFPQKWWLWGEVFTIITSQSGRFGLWWMRRLSWLKPGVSGVSTQVVSTADLSKLDHFFFSFFFASANTLHTYRSVPESQARGSCDLKVNVCQLVLTPDSPTPPPPPLWTQ